MLLLNSWQNQKPDRNALLAEDPQTPALLCPTVLSNQCYALVFIAEGKCNQIIITILISTALTVLVLCFSSWCDIYSYMYFTFFKKSSYWNCLYLQRNVWLVGIHLDTIHRDKLLCMLQTLLCFNEMSLVMNTFLL